MAKTKTELTNRLKEDYLQIKKYPVPYVTVEPMPLNILEWHYVVKGPEESPYEGGYYHGKIIFPKDFPIKAPSIYMITPNGRFKTNTRLITAPDTWNPASSITTILDGLLSYMLAKTHTLGSISTLYNQKRRFAAESLEFNLKNKTFFELFPDYVAEIEELLKQRQESKLQVAESEVASDQHSKMQNRLTNLFVLIGILCSSYVVKYVVDSIPDD